MYQTYQGTGRFSYLRTYEGPKVPYRYDTLLHHVRACGTVRGLYRKRMDDLEPFIKAVIIQRVPGGEIEVPLEFCLSYGAGGGILNVSWLETERFDLGKDDSDLAQLSVQLLFDVGARCLLLCALVVEGRRRICIRILNRLLEC